MKKYKYALPMWGECYHYTEDEGVTVYCGSKVEIWLCTNNEPYDFRQCMRCEWKRRNFDNQPGTTKLGEAMNK